MEAIVIRTKGKADLKFWLDLARKTGNMATTIDTEDLEDQALGEMIAKGLESRTLTANEQADFIDSVKESAGR